jgi:putative oxidoreductase
MEEVIMKSFLGKLEPYIYSLFRIIAGFLFLWHGSEKLFGFPPMAGGGHMPAVMLYISGSIEFVGGLLIMLGIIVPIAAFIASGEMAVAYFMVHAPHAFLPIVNQGELAALYCLAFLFIAARGSGLWSIDSLIFKSKK